MVVEIVSIVKLGMSLFHNYTSRSSQKAQFEFQKELQAEQWEKSQALQKEIRELNAKDTRENQRRAAENQRDLVEMQYELNHWPLSVSPAVLRRQVETYLNEGKEVPLHVIVSSSGALKGSVMNLGGVIKDGMREAFSFISMHYSRNCETPVIMYTNADSQKELGPEQVDTIYAVLPGAPVIVLMPQCQDTCFVLKCSYWGVGEVQQPEHLELFRCDLKVMQNELLRQFGASWPEDQKRLSLPADANKDVLHKLVIDERNAIERARQRGATDDDISVYILPGFEKEYAKKEIIGTFQHAVTQNAGYLLNSACKTIVTLLADTHYLLSACQQPKLPCICRDILEKEPSLLSLTQTVYSQLMEQSQDLLSKPLMHAQLCNAYGAGAFFAYAEQEKLASINSLKEIIPHPERGDWLVVDDLRSGVQELIKASGNEVNDPFLTQCSCALNADSLNRQAAELYKMGDPVKAAELWKQAADQGSAKAALNLALVSYLPKKDWDNLESSLLKAYKSGVDIAQQVVNVVQLCRAGRWATSFLLLLSALEHTEQAKREIAVAYTCLLMLTSLRRDLSAESMKKWCVAACRDLKRNRMPNSDEYPQLALMWLQKEYENGANEARNALRAIACRHSGDAARPLFGAGSVDDRYVLDSPESLWPDAQHRKDVMHYLSTL